MQKTLTSVALWSAPSAMQALGGVPVSVTVVANGFRNAPLLCCRHDVKFPFVHCESAVHECGGFSYAPLISASKQKPQKTRACAEVENAVFVCVSSTARSRRGGSR